jgi:hypothetical protein
LLHVIDEQLRAIKAEARKAAKEAGGSGESDTSTGRTKDGKARPDVIRPW